MRVSLCVYWGSTPYFIALLHVLSALSCDPTLRTLCTYPLAIFNDIFSSIWCNPSGVLRINNFTALPASPQNAPKIEFTVMKVR